MTGSRTWRGCTCTVRTRSSPSSRSSRSATAAARLQGPGAPGGGARAGSVARPPFRRRELGSGVRSLAPNAMGTRLVSRNRSTGSILDRQDAHSLRDGAGQPHHGAKNAPRNKKAGGDVPRSGPILTHGSRTTDESPPRGTISGGDRIEELRFVRDLVTPKAGDHLVVDGDPGAHELEHAGQRAPGDPELHVHAGQQPERAALLVGELQRPGPPLAVGGPAPFLGARVVSSRLQAVAAWRRRWRRGRSPPPDACRRIPPGRCWPGATARRPGATARSWRCTRTAPAAPLGLTGGSAGLARAGTSCR